MQSLPIQDSPQLLHEATVPLQKGLVFHPASTSQFPPDLPEGFPFGKSCPAAV